MCRPRVTALGMSLGEPQSDTLIMSQGGRQPGRGPASELRASTLEEGPQAPLSPGMARRHREAFCEALWTGGHPSSPSPVIELVCCDRAVLLCLSSPCPL